MKISFSFIPNLENFCVYVALFLEEETNHLDAEICWQSAYFILKNKIIRRRLRKN